MGSFLQRGVGRGGVTSYLLNFVVVVVVNLMRVACPLHVGVTLSTVSSRTLFLVDMKVARTHPSIFFVGISPPFRAIHSLRDAMLMIVVLQRGRVALLRHGEAGGTGRRPVDPHKQHRHTGTHCVCVSVCGGGGGTRYHARP